MADYKFPPFVKLAGDAVVFNQDGEFIFYVPDVYFDRKNVSIEGEYVNLIGILDYAIFDEKGKTSGLKRFQLPTRFLSKPSKIEKQKKVKLTKYTDVADYVLLHYYKGDPIFTTTKLVQDISNTEEFFKIFKSGKLPTTIPYDKIQDYFIEALELNGESFGLSLQVFGVIASEYCRDPNNLNRPFRLTNFNDLTSYATINITDIPKYVSAYASITSENWDNAVVGAIVSTTDVKTPMEKLIMG